jgi:hypothetical protein
MCLHRNERGTVVKAERVNETESTATSVARCRGEGHTVKHAVSVSGITRIGKLVCPRIRLWRCVLSTHRFISAHRLVIYSVCDVLHELIESREYARHLSFNTFPVFIIMFSRLLRNVENYTELYIH